MFGKPEWFRKKAWGWGLVPVTWQGYAYTAAWCALFVIPFVALVASRRVPEALIWLAASVGGLYWDVRQMYAAKSAAPPPSDVLYIGDDDEGVQTRQLDLRLRK